MAKKIKNYTMTTWTLKEIRYQKEVHALKSAISLGYNICSVDTETTGLHIILDKAFCISFTLVNTERKTGRAYIVNIKDKSEEFIQELEELFLMCKKIVFWNAKFDLHMLYNIGMTHLVSEGKLTDAMIYARLAADALPPKKGGVVLKLKPYSAKYLDSDAQVYEKELAAYKKNLVTQQNNLLKLNGAKIGELKEFLKDKINDQYSLDPKIRLILNDPQFDTNNYSNIPWSILKKYAAFDAIFTIENYLRDYTKVKEREQMRIAEREEKLIPILWEMERTGFKLNTFYLKQAKYDLKNYIIEERKELERLAGEPIKVGQHEKIKEIFRKKWNINLVASDEDALKEITDPNAKPFVDLIIELRTYEKWYSTYICKWDTYSSKTDRIYSELNQVGAVSGRFSSDFQQFPKEPIYKKDGTLLFSPRRIVQVSGGDYDMLALIDYAAEELRIQAVYTIIIGKPDINLCRAYLPLNCTERDGKYYLDEDPNTEWKPTDLHTLTTLTAFPHLTVDDPNFSHYRKMGKCTNFACNYGASKKTLVAQFGYPEDVADKLYTAYNTAFKGIADYREYVKDVLRYQDYITNLFGRKYYNCSWHNAANYLVQGSGADLLKIKLIELNDYIKINGYKSRLLCTIHDEIMFEIYKDEHHLVKEFKRILEDVPNSPIPFVAEPEVTRTTWDMKKKEEI